MTNNELISGGPVRRLVDWPEKNWRAHLEVLCAQSPEANLLRRDLRSIQNRLGGPDELPEDYARIANIAHALNNMLCGSIGA